MGDGAQHVLRTPVVDVPEAAEDAYRIALAVPGYELDDLKITQQGNVLLINGKSGAAPQDDTLYSGLRRGDFAQRFELADHVDVTGAELKNGILTIELKEATPEAMKPRQIPIGTRPGLIENRKAA